MEGLRSGEVMLKKGDGVKGDGVKGDGVKVAYPSCR
eukprot:COSAG02_NODE_11860_length_1641_cov_1.950713_3_plen_35_part_01